MSDYENHIGKLIPFVQAEDEHLINYARRVFGNDFNEDYWNVSRDIEQFIDESNIGDQYLIHNEIVYKIESNSISEEEDSFIRMHYNKDSSISFSTRFYNGGTCFQEMLDEGLDDFLDT